MANAPSGSSPAYSLLDGNDPFVNTPPAPAPPQQPLPVDYRARYGYGPEIPAPEDIVKPPFGPNDKLWYTITRGVEILITPDWYVF